MAVRIQLASNFLVVELTYDDWTSVDADEVEAATELVNKLGKDVVNDIKKPVEKKPTTQVVNKSEDKVEMATPKQIDCLTRYNKFTREQAEAMTKEEARIILMNMVEQSKQKSH